MDGRLSQDGQVVGGAVAGGPEVGGVGVQGASPHGQVLGTQESRKEDNLEASPKSVVDVSGVGGILVDSQLPNDSQRHDIKN